MSNAERIRQIQTDLIEAQSTLHAARTYLNDELKLSDARLFSLIDDAHGKVKSASAKVFRLSN